MIFLDTEDYDAVGSGWFIYGLRVRNKPLRTQVVARTETRLGRGFRLYLHREVAMRQDPGLIKKKFRVYPLNGNYLDCRRENLNVVVAKPRAGHPGIEPRGKGWFKRPFKGTRITPDASPAWAGGYLYVALNRTTRGEGFRIRKCIGRTPVD